MTDILIADDHPIVLEGLVALLGAADYSVVARCSNGEEVLQSLQTNRPDILLLDINMPGLTGLEIARMLIEKGGEPAIVLLTSTIDKDQVAETIDLGIRGLVLKESAARQLLHCLETVRSGDYWIDPQITRRSYGGILSAGQETMEGGQRHLTPREFQVTRLVAFGFRNKEISREMKITEGTVKTYLHTIYEKLGVGSRVELTNFARDKRLVP